LFLKTFPWEKKMKELTAKQRPIFLVFGLLFLTAWLSSASLFYFGIIKKMPLEQIGYDKIAVIAISAALIIWLMLKNRFLRPNIKKTAPLIIALRAGSLLAVSAALMLFGQLLISFILMTGSYTLILKELICFVCLIIFVYLIEMIFIPAVKTCLRQKES
jgi:hypothetical protein